jgi:hypothetical protein
LTDAVTVTALRKAWSRPRLAVTQPLRKVTMLPAGTVAWPPLSAQLKKCTIVDVDAMRIQSFGGAITSDANIRAAAWAT